MDLLRDGTESMKEIKGGDLAFIWTCDFFFHKILDMYVDSTGLLMAFQTFFF